MERWGDVVTFLTTGEYPPGSNSSQKFYFRRFASKFTIKDGELLCGNKKVVKSKEEARSIVEEFHSSPMGGHLGIIKTRNAVSSRFFWTGMTREIDSWVKECDKCQKFGKPVSAPQLLEGTKVSAVWELVAIDVTGPYPETADGFQYVLTATDYFSKWVEAYPLRSKLAADVGRRLCSMICRHGCPKQILCDLGEEYVSQLNNWICSYLEIESNVMASYHSESNGLDKKINDNLKRVLRKFVNEKQNSWDVHLDAMLFSMRSKVQTTTKHSPFLLMYGREALYPSEVPAEIPLSNIILPPDEHTYAVFLDDKKTLMESLRVTTMENLEKSQDKRRMVYKRKMEEAEVVVEETDLQIPLLLTE